MSLVPKQQITILAVSAGLSGFSLGSILNFTDPYSAAWPVFTLLYLSIFLLAFSTLSLLAFGIKRWLWPKIYVSDLASSLRQGALIGIFMTVTVLLQMNGILFWWLEFSLILFFIILEIFINLKQ